MAKDLIVNGVTYPGTDIMEMQTADGGKALYADTGDTTVTAAAMLKGTKARDKDGALVEGEIEEVERATPFFTVNGDTVSVWAYQNEGYVQGGEITAEKQLEWISGKEITPGAEEQSVRGNRFLKGDIVVKGDPDLVPENIVKGATIFDVEGAAETGGVEPPDSLALDPDVVYATTRPKDWLPMPTPGDDEIYILCHVYDGLTAQFTANITISGTSTLEFGTVNDGVFVAKETMPSSSGGKINKTIDSAEYGSLTSDGKKQCMIRIRGPVTEFNGCVNKGPHPGVEVVCGVKLNKIQFGYTGTNERSWINLRYVSFIGNGGAANLDQAFYWCTALLCIRCEKENEVTSIMHTFRECPSLISVSNKLAVGTNTVKCNYFAQRIGCGVFPKFAIRPSSLYLAFQYAAVNDIDFATIDTSECTDMNSAFRYGYNIRSIRNLNISSLSDANLMFSHLYNLQRLTFAGATTRGGFSISVSAIGLTRAALLETLNSLPTATAAATLNISGCGGASELTEADIAIATAKNWTIVI